jgi:hypothetical protein
LLSHIRRQDDHLASLKEQVKDKEDEVEDEEDKRDSKSSVHEEISIKASKQEAAEEFKEPVVRLAATHATRSNSEHFTAMGLFNRQLVREYSLPPSRILDKHRSIAASCVEKAKEVALQAAVIGEKIERATREELHIILKTRPS